jgi:hypothetical protein
VATRTRQSPDALRRVPRAPATCSECGAKLSSYNPGPNCYAHTLDIPWKGPGVRVR